MTIQEHIPHPPPLTHHNIRSAPECRYFARTILSRYSNYVNISLSSPHWQLKDLLLCSNSSGKSEFSMEEDYSFLFPYKNRVFSLKHSSLNAKRRVHTDLLDYTSVQFQSTPRCLDELDGIIVTGGISSVSTNDSNPIGIQKGSFSIYNSSTDMTEDFQVGDFITNSVNINKIGNNQYRSYLCNNDKHLYQYDILPSSVHQSATPINLKVALNHSILSPDNKTLITVGDSSKIFLSHPTEDSHAFEILKTEGDCGFSTSFLSNGYQFVTCFQDGLALIYDLRNLNAPIHTIHSTRPKTQPGAFRVVKTTSYNNNDLICISEHQGRIHLIDTRNFSNHSVILLPKYLYNVPPSVSTQTDSSDSLAVYEKGRNASHFKMFGRYPIATAPTMLNSSGTGNEESEEEIYNEEPHGSENENGQEGSSFHQSSYTDAHQDEGSRIWYNQPIIKDFEDFKDLNSFGGDLNMGYLESYRYLDSRYSLGSSSSYRPNIFRDGYRIVLQGTFDREDILRRRAAMDINPLHSNLLSYNEVESQPTRIRNDSITELGRSLWWNQDDEWNHDKEDTFKENWPFGRNTDIIKQQTCDRNVNILETPLRDPFFYVDSDIEINGMELANKAGDTTLCIGTKEGIVLWDINGWKRQCFPSFEYT